MWMGSFLHTDTLTSHTCHTGIISCSFMNRQKVTELHERQAGLANDSLQCHSDLWMENKSMKPDAQHIITVYFLP